MLGECARGSREPKRRGDSGDRYRGIAEELSPTRDRARVTLFSGGTFLVLDYWTHCVEPTFYA
jgi:hypothetical protein